MGYKKLKDVQQFTAKEIKGKYWFKWDNVNQKALKSENYQPGFSLRYDIETDQGTISFSQDQLGQMLVATFQLSNGTANFLNRTFVVKTNGKAGIEIRYFLNLLNPMSVAQAKQKEEINPDEVPF